METTKYKVEVRNLTKNFGSLKVLNDISFNIKKGEFLCIVGPTGCGKTTFLNLLTRIYMPTKGDLFIDGERADPKKHNLSFVFQEPSALPWKTVEQNLRFGLELKKRPKEEIDERVLILSNKPTTIKEDLKVDLPRPRDVTSPDFIKLRQYVTDQIKWW